MIYRSVTKNDFEVDEKYKYVGKTMGCSCCSRDEGITPENLKEHIAMLESDLAYALEILEELENGK